jgi:pyruvate carboxylase
MTREEVIELAHKIWASGVVYIGPTYTSLKRFASAVAAHEREQCTKLFKELEHTDEHIASVIEAAVQAEREAFPNLDPVIAWLENGCDPKEAAKELRLYAEAIKARGKS